MAYLLSNYIIKALLEYHHSNTSNLHYLSLEKLVSEQRLKIKSSIVNTNSCLNGILSLFNPLHKELIPGFRLVDIFSKTLYMIPSPLLLYLMLASKIMLLYL